MRTVSSHLSISDKEVRRKIVKVLRNKTISHEAAFEKISSYGFLIEKPNIIMIRKILRVSLYKKEDEGLKYITSYRSIQDKKVRGILRSIIKNKNFSNIAIKRHMEELGFDIAIKTVRKLREKENVKSKYKVKSGIRDSLSDERKKNMQWLTNFDKKHRETIEKYSNITSNGIVISSITGK